jgi:starch synthase (maltosyl-transferring)
VLGIDSGKSFHAADLLSGETYAWQGSRNYVELTPGSRPAHILHLEA